MAMPKSATRRSASGTTARTNDLGDSKIVTNKPTEIMKEPSAQPSIRYSGQCSRKADPIDVVVSSDSARFAVADFPTRVWGLRSWRSLR